MTRALLGVPGDQTGPPVGPPMGGGRGSGGHGGWFAYEGEPGLMPSDYSSSLEISWDDRA